MTVTEVQFVAVSAYGSGAASTRVRIREWLHKVGIDAEVHSYTDAANNQLSTLSKSMPQALAAELSLRKLARRVGSRTVIMSRQASPFSSGGIEESLLRAAAHSVYDFDDALFNDTGRLTRRLWSKNELWSRSVKAADVVIAGSNLLADAASALSDAVVMIPSCIEPGHYEPKSNYDLGEIPRAVWIGSPSTEKYLTLLENALLELHQRKGLRLTVISGGSATLGRLDPMVDRVSWSVDTFARELSAADFGIMPVADTPFARGKCAYKILQYAATALPIIGSPVGANDEVIRQLDGYAAQTSDEWVDAMAAVLEASSLQREKLGQAALKAVTAGYSFDAWEPRWRQAIGLKG